MSIRRTIGRQTLARRTQACQADEEQADAPAEHRRRHRRDGQGDDEAARSDAGNTPSAARRARIDGAVRGLMQAAQDVKRGAIDVVTSRRNLRRAVDLLSVPEVAALHDCRVTDSLAVVKSGRNP